MEGVSTARLESASWILTGTSCMCVRPPMVELSCTITPSQPFVSSDAPRRLSKPEKECYERMLWS